MRIELRTGLLALPFLAFLTIGSLNRAGYCVSELKKISNDIILEAAIADELPRQQATALGAELYAAHIEKRLPDKDISVLPYKNIAEFKKLNPDCCAVVVEITHGGEHLSHSMWEQTTGQALGYLDFSYTVRYYDSHGNLRKRLVQGAPTVTNCGRISYKL